MLRIWRLPTLATLTEPVLPIAVMMPKMASEALLEGPVPARAATSPLASRCLFAQSIHSIGRTDRNRTKARFAPKNKEGQPLHSKVEALEEPRDQTPYLLPPKGMLDRSVIAAVTGRNGAREIKEWQAIMDHLRALPVETKGRLPTVPVDGRAA